MPKMAEEILDVFVPEMVEQLVKLPKTVSEDGIQQRTAGRIADIPVPQTVEELVEVCRVFPQDKGHQCFVEQTDEIPDISFAEKIVERPVAQTQGKTQQVVNTRVQDVVNAEKTTEIPQLKFADLVVDVLAVSVVQVPHVQVVVKAAEIPQLPLVPQAQVVERTVEIPQLLSDVQVPQVQVVTETVEIPQSLFVEKTVMIPDIQTVQGPRTFESLNGEITVAVKIDHETIVQNVAPKTGLDSFIDDLSSTSGSMHQQHTPIQAEIEEESDGGENDEARSKKERKNKKRERGGRGRESRSRLMTT